MNDLNALQNRQNRLITAVNENDAGAALDILGEDVAKNSSLVSTKVHILVGGSSLESSLLAYAIFNGYAAVAGVLWKFDIQERSVGLRVASLGGTAHVMKALLDAGADPNYRWEYDEGESLNRDESREEIKKRWHAKTPLSLASGERLGLLEGEAAIAFPNTPPEETVAVIALLLDRGADPDIQSDHMGTRPLFSAIIYRKTEIVELLLRAGANARDVWTYSGTPLMTAAQRGNADIVRLLLRFGADREMRDEKGRTALDLARMYNNQDEIIQVLSAKPEE